MNMKLYTASVAFCSLVLSVSAAATEFNPIAKKGTLQALVSSAPYIKAVASLQEAAKKIDPYARGYDIKSKRISSLCDRRGRTGQCVEGLVEYTIQVNSCLGDMYDCGQTIGTIAAKVVWHDDRANVSTFGVDVFSVEKVMLNCAVVPDSAGNSSVKLLFQDFDQKWETFDAFKSAAAAHKRIKLLKSEGHCRDYEFPSEN